MKEDILVRFGKQLKILRNEMKISQEELAFRCQLSKNYISDVECGRRNISLKAMDKLSKGLGIELFKLFQFKEGQR